MATTRRGRPPHPDILTPAEWRVVQAVRHGLSNRVIAGRLGVSVDAVKFHVENAVGKLGLSGRAELRRWRGAPMDSPVRADLAAPDLATRAEQEDTMNPPLAQGTIGQVARAVSDVPRAEAWYRDVLGLRHLFTFGKLAFFDCDGTRLMLEDESLSSDPGLKNDSVIYFRVADIHAVQETLSGRGVEFTGAPHMIFKHEDGTEEWMTFFKDPDAHLLALMSQRRE